MNLICEAKVCFLAHYLVVVDPSDLCKCVIVFSEAAISAMVELPSYRSRSITFYTDGSTPPRCTRPVHLLTENPSRNPPAWVFQASHVHHHSSVVTEARAKLSPHLHVQLIFTRLFRALRIPCWRP